MEVRQLPQFRPGGEARVWVAGAETWGRRGSDHLAVAERGAAGGCRFDHGMPRELRDG